MNTPLDLAADAERSKIVKLLLEKTNIDRRRVYNVCNILLKRIFKRCLTSKDNYKTPYINTYKMYKSYK